MNQSESENPISIPPKPDKELLRSVLVECIQKGLHDARLHILDVGRIAMAIKLASQDIESQLKKAPSQGREFIYPTKEIQDMVIRRAVLEGPSATYRTEDEKQRLLEATLRHLAEAQSQ